MTVQLAILFLGPFVSAFQVLGLYLDCHTHPAFSWVLGIQTLVLIFAWYVPTSCVTVLALHLTLYSILFRL